MDLIQAIKSAPKGSTYILFDYRKIKISHDKRKGIGFDICNVKYIKTKPDVMGKNIAIYQGESWDCFLHLNHSLFKIKMRDK